MSFPPCPLLFFLLCLCGLPSVFGFFYRIQLNSTVVQDKIEHRLFTFSPTNGFDVSGVITSVKSIRKRMLNDHQVDIYNYGVEDHLCSATFTPHCSANENTRCLPGNEVKDLFTHYVGGSILLALRGPDCTAYGICDNSCTFVKKTMNAKALNASALVIGHNTTNNNIPCMLGTSASPDLLVPSVLIFNQDYNTITAALTELQSPYYQPPSGSWGEVSDNPDNGAVSIDECAALATPTIFLVIQTGIIPVGIIATFFALKNKLLPEAEEAGRQQIQQSLNNNQNHQMQPEQNGQQQDNNNAAARPGDVGNGEPEGGSHAIAIAIPSSSPAAVEEKASSSFGPAMTTSSAIASGDGVELDDFHAASSRSSSRSLPSSNIDEQALLASDALASDAIARPSSSSVSGVSANRQHVNGEEFDRHALIDSHRRLYGLLDFILGFGSPKSLFYVTLLYNLILLMIIEILLVSARSETCAAADLKWFLVYRAGLCFAAMFHAFGQSFSTIPSVMRLFFYSRAAGIFFSLMFFTSCVSFIVVRKMVPSQDDTYESFDGYDCDTHAPILSSAIFPFFLLFLSGGVTLLLIRFVEQAYAACTQGRTTPAPAYEGLLVLFARALRKHSLSGSVLFGPLDQAEPVTTLQLSLLPTTSFQAGMYPPDDAVCAICLGNYEAGERLRVLPCHHFHSACLDQWITSQKPTCPTCRRAIPLSYQQYEQANQSDAADSNVRRDDRRRDGRMAVPMEDI